MELDYNDLVISTYRTGSGWFPKDNGVTITHIPTEISVSCHSERSQHANRAKAMEQLNELYKEVYKALLNKANMNKPTIDTTRKDLHAQLGKAIRDKALATKFSCTTDDYVDVMLNIFAEYVEFGKSQIQRGSRVLVIDGFSKGSVGTVEFVEPARKEDSKIWMLRDGDSSPKYWFASELELIDAE